ncbi:MAG: DMT family transporter [Anaerolineae bacterium]|nr:DMT family transporter [Anaerolineae bacterium]
MTTPSHTTKPAIPPALGLAVGVTAASTASTFIRLAQGSMTSLAVAAWRLTIATLILAPFAVTTHRAEWRTLSQREWGLIVASGLLLAVHFYTWITSLALTSVAASVVLVATAPLFVGAISHFFLKERMSRRMVIGMAVALAGSLIIGLADAGEGTHQLIGDLLALLGALSVAGYMLIGRRSRARLSLLGYVFPVYGTAALALMVAALFSGVELTGYPVQVWLWLVLVAVFPQIVGHSSLNWALGHVSATFVALAVLAEPIGSTLLAWIVLQEPPTFSTLIGGALILIGIAAASAKPTRTRIPS